MISTTLGYQLYARDTVRSQARVDAEPVNQQAKAYYDANIGKVKTVDDFVNNYKLFSYAMTAYGLSDMTYAKALMKQVLTSDLTNSSSVANKLSDSRYLTMAKAFGFSTTGAVTPTSVQTTAQQSATTAAFQANTATTLDTKTAAAATAYYASHIGTVTSMTALERDPKLYSYVLTAYGLDATTPQATVSALVESSLSDPKSVLNATPGAGYAALNQAVNVSSTGAASTGTQPAQWNDATLSVVSAYSVLSGSSATAQKAAATESNYFATTVPTLTSVDALLADSRLVAYVTKAFGLPQTSATQLRQVLTSDPSDPKSVANTLGAPAYAKLAASFNFAADGTLKTLPFQTTAQQNATVTLYASRQTADTPALDAATAYYKAHIGAVKTVADLEADPKLKSYLMTAYGVGASTPDATLEAVMEQAPGQSGSVVSTTAGARGLLLASAFSVDGTGAALGARQVQSAAMITATTSAYTAASGTDPVSKAAAAAETAYYKSAIGSVSTVGDLLADKRLVSYVLKAYGLPATTTTSQLRSVLTSDPLSAKSVATTLGTTYRTAAAAFTFASTGLAGRAPTTVQSASQQIATDTAYGRVSLENEAGDVNTGVKLALYFQRVAPTITSAYSILADKALLQVFQTTLGLPADSAKADIDSQARYIQSKVNLADLRNPVKLAAMVQRFTAMYDLANPTSDDTIAQLFGTASS